MRLGLIPQLLAKFSAKLRLKQQDPPQPLQQSSKFGPKLLFIVILVAAVAVGWHLYFKWPLRLILEGMPIVRSNFATSFGFILMMLPAIQFWSQDLMHISPKIEQKTSTSIYYCGIWPTHGSPMLSGYWIMISKHMAMHSLRLRMFPDTLCMFDNHFKDLDLLTISIINTNSVLSLWSESVFICLV